MNNFDLSSINWGVEKCIQGSGEELGRLRENAMHHLKGENTRYKTGCTPSLLGQVITMQGRYSEQLQLYPLLGNTDHVIFERILCVCHPKAAPKKLKY